MKLSSALLTAAVIAVAELGGTAMADLFCAKRDRGWGWKWDIHSDDVGNLDAVCRRMWQLLDATGKWCFVDVPRGCKTNKHYPGKKNSLHLWFKTTGMCDDWRVAKAFCEATNSTLGWVECELRTQDWYFDPAVDIIRDG